MNFTVTDIDRKLMDAIVKERNVSPLLAYLLINRGVKDVAAAKRFIQPSFDDLYDPFLLKNMSQAVERIRQAIQNGEKILIYGDEDIDGISSTVVLLETLQNVGADVQYLIPNKTRDGIGLKEKFIDHAHQTGIRLIITVDCGITNLTQVDYAARLGIDVIISDHHQIYADLPRAHAIINPQQADCPYPFKKLSGAGVAYKLSQAVAMRLMHLSSLQWFSVQKEMLNYALLGTIGDRMPLIDENRIFVKFGIESLQQSDRQWVKVILEKFKSPQKSLNMSTILALFIPLLSAGESVDGLNTSCELLRGTDPIQTQRWTDELYTLSQDWSARARNALERIKANLNVTRNSNLLVLLNHETEVDVLSYCASKLKDLLKRPVIMLGVKNDYVIGEGRAPKGFNLIDYFKACDDLLIDYGGHKCAAGFSVHPQNVTATINRLNEAAANTPKEFMVSRATRAEVEISIDELHPNLFTELTCLAPFGEGNPPPLFSLKNVEIRKNYDGYRINSCPQSFWATRHVRQQLNFSIGIVICGDIDFFIDGTGRAYISHFQALKKGNNTVES
ncbi:single-stranded-DNA-specific exonuclease RecJ [candidate division KSB1 bacterium]|nr:single-stranded-DNA-specific exonuclease RecJ [candidate division KSB1 bacterium]